MKYRTSVLAIGCIALIFGGITYGAYMFDMLLTPTGGCYGPNDCTPISVAWWYWVIRVIAMPARPLAYLNWNILGVEGVLAGLIGMVYYLFLGGLFYSVWKFMQKKM